MSSQWVVEPYRPRIRNKTPVLGVRPKKYGRSCDSQINELSIVTVIKPRYIGIRLPAISCNKQNVREGILVHIWIALLEMNILINVANGIRLITGEPQ